MKISLKGPQLRTGMIPLRRAKARHLEAERLEAERLEEQKREAQKSVLDLTRNIHRKKERELADLQLTGSNGTGKSEPASNNKGPKVGRNDLCPCGSGKKYKKCHG